MSLSGETGSSLEKFVGTRVDFFDTNRDMKIERPLSSLKATNGLMSSYAPRPHKRKRKGLRIAVVVLLLAVAGVVYFSDAASAQANDQQFIDRVDKAERNAAEVCVTLMERINGMLKTTINTFPPYVPEEAQQFIEAFDAYCKGQ